MSQELRQQSKNKNCLFELFRKHVKSGNLKRFKNLLEIHEISPTEIRTNSNTTLLHIAALYNKPKIATFLMSSGLSMHEQNSKNYCPYFLAVLHNSKRVMECMER